jgi:hypothetical protein
LNWKLFYELFKVRSSQRLRSVNANGGAAAREIVRITLKFIVIAGLLGQQGFHFMGANGEIAGNCDQAL